jgi:3-phosphoshikimate 1-carboxyvinyltransferase
LRLFAKNTSILSGEVDCPGDKSISQRAIIIGALANQNISITGFLNGEDPLSTLSALNQIGADISINNNEVTINEREMIFSNPSNFIDLGNSGTGMRLIMGLIAGTGLKATLIGDESLMKRPMSRVSIPLNEMGANVADSKGLPPIQINPGAIRDNFAYKMPIASAQVKSSILLAGVASNKKVSIFEPSITRDHTEIMLKHFGLNIKSEEENDGKRITFTPGNKLLAKDYDVVGDFSSAAFLIIAGLIASDSKIFIKNVGLNPTRSGLVDILIKMGGNIKIKNKNILSGELVGDIFVESSELKGVDIRGGVIANIIDEIPILSIAAACAEGTTRISDAHELRVKESDRLEAISSGLTKLKVKHELFEDGISIDGGIPENNKVIEIDSYGDHRIAMSFLISSLKVKSGVSVDNCKNIYTSYPNFVETMNGLGLPINEQ